MHAMPILSGLSWGLAKIKGNAKKPGNFKLFCLFESDLDTVDDEYKKKLYNPVTIGKLVMQYAIGCN